MMSAIGDRSQLSRLDCPAGSKELANEDAGKLAGRVDVCGLGSMDLQ
jgi:hypothetical protein